LQRGNSRIAVFPIFGWKNLEKMEEKLCFTREGDSNNSSHRRAARCNFCAEFWDPSTAKTENLVRHIKSCPKVISSDDLANKRAYLAKFGPKELQKNTMTSFIGKKLSEDEKLASQKYLLLWFVTSAIPFNAIDNPWAKKFVNTLCPSYKLISRRILGGILLNSEYEEVSI